MEQLTTDSAKELLALCRAGRLYEIEHWIAASKPLKVPERLRKTLLQVAVEIGFHSLIELIARHDPNQESKNAALRDAVRLRRLDFVELLVANGADARSVDFAEVLLSWDPKLMRFFLDNGADVVTGSPFAVAFAEKIRTALRTFVQCKESHPELAPELQKQADSALRHFCRKNDLKWINLLIWVGADPRSLGPCFGDEYGDDPECYTSGLREACEAGNLDAVKKIKPDSAQDNMDELLEWASYSRGKTLIRYLLELGANPNNKENGGSTAVDRCLWHLNFGSYESLRWNRQRSTYELSDTLECLRELVTHGAKWVPKDRNELTSVRRALLGCEPRVTVDLLKALLPNGCSRDTVGALLRTPAMKQHISSESWHLARLKLKEDKPRIAKESVPPRDVLSRYDRADLYERIWSQPMRTVAKEYGVSDVWLGKVCRALKVPVPGRGYWAGKYAGKPSRKRPALPMFATAEEQL